MSLHIFSIKPLQSSLFHAIVFILKDRLYWGNQLHKKSKNMRRCVLRIKSIILAISLMLFIIGCATTPTPTPTVQEEQPVAEETTPVETTEIETPTDVAGTMETPAVEEPVVEETTVDETTRAFERTQQKGM